jgi:hypothetical protein
MHVGPGDSQRSLASHPSTQCSLHPNSRKPCRTRRFTEVTVTSLLGSNATRSGDNRMFPSNIPPRSSDLNSKQSKKTAQRSSGNRPGSLQILLLKKIIQFRRQSTFRRYETLFLRPASCRLLARSSITKTEKFVPPSTDNNLHSRR